MTRQVRARQGDTLDAVLYRTYGQTAGITERTLAMNRHLAALGPVLPEGTLILLPGTPLQAETKKPNVQLWE